MLTSPFLFGTNGKKYILKLLCSEPLALCESRSEQIPNGVYFKYQKNRCLFFQRGDEMLSGRNLVRLEEKKKLRVKSELLRTTHPRKPRCLQFSAMGTDSLWIKSWPHPLK